MNVEGYPHDTDAEEALLGAALTSSAAAELVVDGLTEDDYWRGAHRLIHRAITDLARRRDGIDAVNVAAWLDANLVDPAERSLWADSGRGYLFGLGSGVFVSAHAAQYAATVKRHALSRRTLRALEQAARSVADGDDPAAVLAEHAKTVARLSTTGSDRRLYHLRDVAAEWVEETRNDAQGGGRRLGWPTLDAALTTPIRRSEVISVAARAGVGKTYALVDVAAHMIETGPGVALFNSLEMPRTDIFERVAGQALDQRSDELRAAALTDDAIWPMIEDARPDLDRFRIDDRPSSIHNLSQICASARRDGLDPAIVCIDYLGLLRWEGAKGAPLYERVSETARAIKDFAKSENVVVLMAVQLNRSAGAGERPTMEMLRDSGAIEEVSDRIIALYAPERDPKCTDAERIAYPNLVPAFFLTNRQGPLGDEAQLIYTPGRRLREIADD